MTSKIRWSIFRSLRHRNFGLFFVGQGISLIGTWMQQIAMSWLVYRLTHSAFLLGVIGFCNQIPVFLLASFAGVFADRWNRRRMLLATQSLAMIQAFLLAYLTFKGTIAVWHLILLGLFMGSVNAFDVPIRQAFLVDMVDQKEDFGNAIALNSSVFNVAQFLGPALAGLLIASTGEGICFLTNGLSFFAVIAALLMMKLPPPPTLPPVAGAWARWKEGVLYAFKFPPIRAILTLLAIVGLVASSQAVLMPVFSAKVLGGGPHMYGFLMGASGVGAFIGAMLLVCRKNVLGLGRWIVVATGLLGIGLMALAFTHVGWFSAIVLLLIGGAGIVLAASSNTILQLVVDEDKRGRVMSYFTMAIMGAAPFGSLLAGALADHLGVSSTFFVIGFSCVLGAFFFERRLLSLNQVLHPICARLGIIPEVATGIESAVNIRRIEGE